MPSWKIKCNIPVCIHQLFYGQLTIEMNQEGGKLKTEKDLPQQSEFVESNQFSNHACITSREHSLSKKQSFCCLFMRHPCQLLGYISGIISLQLQLCKCVWFTDWLPTKSGAVLPYWKALCFTTCFPKFTKWYKPLNLKLLYNTCPATSN